MEKSAREQKIEQLYKEMNGVKGELESTANLLCKQKSTSEEKTEKLNTALLKIQQLEHEIQLKVCNAYNNDLQHFVNSLGFSSPQPKSQVSFSDQNLSIVCRRCRSCSLCRKLFTFSSSSPEPLGKFQPNLAQIIFG